MEIQAFVEKPNFKKHYTGYLLIPVGHKMHGKHYNDLPKISKNTLNLSSTYTVESDMLKGDFFPEHITVNENSWLFGFELDTDNEDLAMDKTIAVKKQLNIA